MKFSNILSTISLFASSLTMTASSPSSLAMASDNGKMLSTTHNENKGASKQISANMLQRLLLQLNDIDTREELMEACNISIERFFALKRLQRWLVKQEFDGDLELFQTFKEKSVAIIFFLVGKDPSKDELGTQDFLAIVSMSGISGLSFDELLDCVGNGVSLTYDEILYIFCLGDPHFVTWQGAHFDYHGQCDMVMIHNEEFGNDQGLDLHIRTEQIMPEGAFSFVSSAALRIGKDVLEVNKDGEHFFNGQKNADLSRLGGYPVTRSVRKNCVQNAENGEKALGCNQMLTYDITFGPTEHIQLKIAKNMVHVEVKGSPLQFQGSSGVMGTYPHAGHGRVARDGTTLMQDVEEFGQEWQVRPDIDGRLFQNMEQFPQYPQQCKPASTSHASNQRKLRAGTAEEKALHDLAHGACDHLLGKDDNKMHKNCIFDVMATGDAEMATTVYGSF